MSSGWRAPAPLPMYQPVVLKHVPTMVRRRYDHLDVHHLDQPQPQPQPQDTPTSDSENENDGDLVLIDEDARGSKTISTDQGGCNSEDDDLEASNLSHEVDNGVSVECQQSEVENSIEDCETETQSKHVDNGSIKSTDLQSEYSECDNDVSNIVNDAPTVEWTLEDETRDKRLASFSNEKGSVSEDDGCDRSEMEHLEFILDTDVNDETLGNGQENASDDQESCQSQDDSQQDYNLSGEADASVSVEGQHNRLGNSTDDCVTRTCSESIGNRSTGQPEYSKSKDDGSNVVNHALIMDSILLEDESHESKHKRLASFSNEQALHSKYSENEDDGPKLSDHAPTMVTGWPAPPPLPMYHPVALHHVPTMVRRSYEHFDTDKLDQIEDAPKNGGKFEDDGDLDSIHDEGSLGSENSSFEQGSALEDEDCDGSDMEHSSCIVDTSVKGWRESVDDDLQDSNPSSEVDDGISVECQLNGEENSTDNCESGTYCERVGTRSIKPTDLDSNVSNIKDNSPKVANHALVVDFNLDEDENQHKRLACLSNEQALHSENSESANDVPKLFNHVPIVEFNHENVMQDTRLIDFKYEEVFKTEASKKSIEEDIKFQGRSSPPPLPMYQPVALKHVPTMVRKRYERSDAEPLYQIEDVPAKDDEIEDDGDLHDEDGLLSENISSEQGWHEGEADYLQNSNSSCNVDSCVSVECQQSEGENSIDDCDTGIYNGTVNSRDIHPTDLHSGNRESEDDESKVANNAPIVDSNLDEGETQGDSKDEYNGAEDAKTASYPSAKYESLDVTDGNSTDEQGLYSEDNKRDGDISEGNSSFCTNASLKSEAEVIERGSIDDDKQDTITQMYTEDFGTQNIIRRRSLDIMNLKSKSNGTEDINSSYNMYTVVKTEVQDASSQRNSNCQIEFKPETLRKSMEDDVYELCCPYCKHCFTNPLIVQRKENSQQCRITCFTSLIALFCCGRD